MKVTLTHLALAAALCGALGCSTQKVDSPSTNGTVKITAKPVVSNAAHSNTSSDAICADFTVTAYSFNAAHAPQAAGNPVTFSTNKNSPATDQILGCIDGPKNFAYQAPAGSLYTSASYNWAYLVSATNFEYCDHTPGGHTLVQSTVNPAPAYFAPVNCSTSNDVKLSIDYPVSLSAVSPTGDIDISAGVDATTEYVGCKKAEIVNHELRFAQSNAIDTKTAVPLGLVGFATTSTPRDATLAQYGGQTWAANPSGSGKVLYNTYYSGQFTTGAGALPTTLVQTFLTNHDETHLFSAAPDGQCVNGEWVDSRHAYCLTTIDNTLADTDPNKVVTVGKLADAFVYVPGAGFVLANVGAGGSGVTLYAQMANNSLNDYSSPTHAVVTANANPGFASTATSPAPGKGFNDQLAPQTVAAPTGLVISGLYVDPSASGQFLVGATETISGSNLWATLTQTGGVWSYSPFKDFGAGVPPGFGVSASGCVTTGTTATTPPTLVSIEVTPGNALIAIGGESSQQYHAIGHWSDGTTTNLDGLVSWGSSIFGIVVDATSGVASSAATVGTATITAFYAVGGVIHSGSALLTVVARPVMTAKFMVVGGTAYADVPLTSGNLGTITLPAATDGYLQLFADGVNVSNSQFTAVNAPTPAAIDATKSVGAEGARLINHGVSGQVFLSYGNSVGALYFTVNSL